MKEDETAAAFKCITPLPAPAARSIAKFNMSLCTLGHAEEFRHDGIAVNRRGRPLRRRMMRLLPCDCPPLPLQHLAPHRHRHGCGRQSAGRRRVPAAVAAA